MPKPRPVSAAPRLAPRVTGELDERPDGDAERPPRVAAVESLVPKGLSPWLLEQVRGPVLDLMANTPQGATPSHAYRQWYGYALHLAAWELARHGSLDLRRAFSDQRIEEFLADRFGSPPNPGTSATIRSKLTRIRMANWPDLDRRREAIPRPKLPPPYPPGRVATLRRRVGSLPAPLADEWLILLALTLGAGLRAGEVDAARADAVDHQARGTVLKAPRSGGGVREIPLPGWAGESLTRRASEILPQECLFVPHGHGRGRIVALLKRIDRRFPTEERFNLGRARTTWLVHLLESDVSFAAVASVADLSPRGHAAAGLLAYVDVKPTSAGALWRAVAR